MALPITIPNTFGGATVPIPLSQLDNNFSTVVNGINGIGNGTNSLANVSITGGSIANVTLSGTVTAPTNGYRRNRIINGDMRIDQRNAGTAQTVTTAGAYNLDRWVVLPSGASVTAQRVAGSSGFQYATQITGAASVTGINFLQRIEAVNVADLVNQNVTLTATISNSLLTNVDWYAYYANTIDNFNSITLITYGSFTMSATATQYTATFNLGANAANGVLINFSVGAQTSGTWTVTGVQLEAGSSSTPFERLPIGETLMLCQRYYFSTQASIYGSIAFTGELVQWNSIFSSTMRAAPTATITGASPSGSMNAGPSVANTYSGSISLTTTAFSSFLSNGACAFTLNCSAEL